MKYRHHKASWQLYWEPEGRRQQPQVTQALLELWKFHLKALSFPTTGRGVTVVQATTTARGSDSIWVSCPPMNTVEHNRRLLLALVILGSPHTVPLTHNMEVVCARKRVGLRPGRVSWGPGLIQCVYKQKIRNYNEAVTIELDSSVVCCWLMLYLFIIQIYAAFFLLLFLVVYSKAVFLNGQGGAKRRSAETE